MRISELSRLGGVPTATVKYYLREGLLPAGRLTSATQAQYDEGHLSRLRLIRALVGPGGLSIAAVRSVLEAIDDPPESPLELLGRATEALSMEQAEGAARSRDDAGARRMVTALGWSIAESGAAIGELAAALDAIDEAQLTLLEGGVARYAEVLHGLAVEEVATVPDNSPEAAVRQVVLGTVLIEPLLLALRRLALQDAAGRRFGVSEGDAQSTGV
ncbi:MerR family transcriptional regulator [Raineyella fluvialis]|uniref:MerR family transcriptional regulator n=1 Tax=Raineyella fluvialis TaxID=2662261 RepID=A0A5Q2FB18_9ACTN|nr:MerR family transcriptional regulator [Raineyella fluvialis]QGF24062.1 MerR family transcriptional regulator [Raineyella fluvialis]